MLCLFQFVASLSFIVLCFGSFRIGFSGYRNRFFARETYTYSRYAAVAVIYYLIEPTWVQALLDDPWGLLLLAVAVFLNIAGFLWIRKIATFEI